MIDILTLAVLFVSGFALGFKVSDIWHTRMIREILERAGLDDEKLHKVVNSIRAELPEDHEDSLPKVEVKIEQHGAQLYAYRVDNEEFLGQGSDRESLMTAIQEKTNDNFIMVVRQDQGGELLQKSN
jgi:hypothetical protein